MAAATAARDAQRKGKDSGEQLAYKVATVTASRTTGKIWKGTLVMADTVAASGINGLLKPAEAPVAAAVNDRFMGVASQSVDNSTVASGTYKCLVEKEGTYTFVYGPGFATDALIGSEVYAADDSTVSNVSTNAVKVGAVQEVIDANTVRVKIDNYVK